MRESATATEAGAAISVAINAALPDPTASMVSYYERFDPIPKRGNDDTLAVDRRAAIGSSACIAFPVGAADAPSARRQWLPACNATLADNRLHFASPAGPCVDRGEGNYTLGESVSTLKV